MVYKKFIGIFFIFVLLSSSILAFNIRNVEDYRNIRSATLDDLNKERQDIDYTERSLLHSASKRNRIIEDKQNNLIRISRDYYSNIRNIYNTNRELKQLEQINNITSSINMSNREQLNYTRIALQVRYRINEE